MLLFIAYRFLTTLTLYQIEITANGSKGSLPGIWDIFLLGPYPVYRKYF